MKLFESVTYITKFAEHVKAMYDLREYEDGAYTAGYRINSHELVGTHHDTYIVAIALGEPIMYRWDEGYRHRCLPSYMVKCLILLQSGKTVVRYLEVDDLVRVC